MIRARVPALKRDDRPVGRTARVTCGIRGHSSGIQFSQSMAGLKTASKGFFERQANGLLSIDRCGNITVEMSMITLKSSLSVATPSSLHPIFPICPILPICPTFQCEQ